MVLNEAFLVLSTPCKEKEDEAETAPRAAILTVRFVIAKRINKMSHTATMTTRLVVAMAISMAIPTVLIRVAIKIVQE